MSSPVRSIMRRLSGKPLAILSFAMADCLFELSLAQLGYTIYVPAKTGKVNTSLSHDNLVYVFDDIHDMPISYEFDCVLINDKLGHYDMGSKIASYFHVPLIMAEHYYQPEGIKQESALLLQSQKFYQRINCAANVAESWGSKADLSINYHVPVTNLPKTNKVVAYGNFGQPDAQIVNFLRSKIPNIKLVGSGYGVEPHNLLHELLTCQTFINLVNSTRIPLPMLYALGAGARVISSPCPYQEAFDLIGVESADVIPSKLNLPFKNQQEKIAEIYSEEQFLSIKQVFESIREFTWK